MAIPAPLPKVVDAYKKDEQAESFLAKFNAHLESFETSAYSDLPELYPTIHIVGVPRSGTTLLNQLIASHTNIGYINHLIAAFWQSPATGIRLSQKLIGHAAKSSYASDFGRTHNIYEPHEFGYFWRRLLNYPDMQQRGLEHESIIDWEHLRTTLINMTHAYQRPIVFKSFHAGWHARTLTTHLPKSCWLFVERDPLSNAISLVQLREKMYGDVAIWGSARPQTYSKLKDKPIADQIAGQIHDLQQTYRAQLAPLDSQNKLSLRYADLCNNPSAVLKSIVKMVSTFWPEAQITSPPPSQFEHRVYHAQSHSYGPQLAESLKNNGLVS